MNEGHSVAMYCSFTSDILKSDRQLSVSGIRLLVRPKRYRSISDEGPTVLYQTPENENIQLEGASTI